MVKVKAPGKKKKVVVKPIPKAEIIEAEEEENKGGRPTEYSEEKLEFAVEYLTKWHTEYGEPIPTIESLCVHLGIGKATIYRWANGEVESIPDESAKRFRDVLDAIMAIQGKELIFGSLAGEFQPIISRMMLAAKHGYNEKVQVDHTSKGDKIEGFNYLPPGETEDEVQE